MTVLKKGNNKLKIQDKLHLVERGRGKVDALEFFRKMEQKR